MKAAFLTNELFYGGGTRSLYLLIKSLPLPAEEKFLFVATPPSREFREDFEKHCGSVRVASVTALPGNASRRMMAAAKKETCGELIEALKRERVDVLHINGAVFPHVAEAVEKYGVCRVVTHVREMVHRWGNVPLREYALERIARCSDRIIAITPYEAEPFRPHPGLRVLPNPFDFSKTEGTPAGAPEAGPVRVGVISDFYRAKGQLDFLEAMSLILSRRMARTSFHGVLVGAPAPRRLWRYWNRRETGREIYSRQVRWKLISSGLKGRVDLIPYQYDIFETLRTLDIVVRPSRWGDPWGRDVIEAMAFGKPVVATGTASFFVEDGVTGYLVPPGDPGAMAERIAALINDPESRRRFGERGKEKVRGLCDMEAYGRAVLELYRDLMKGKREAC